MSGRGGALLLCAALAACGGALFTAPPGSTLTLIANPTFIRSHGGVSVLSAVVIEPTGTPVPDGTVVQFFTNLGQVNGQGRTRDGVARVNFVSDSRSGDATITAISGGGTVTGPSPSPTTQPSGNPGDPFARTGQIASVRDAASSAQASDTVTVTVGNVRVSTVLLRADPPRITISQSTHVIATVLDVSGNPVENAPVYFRVVSDPTTEFFDRQGPVFTNANGEAEDVMRTRRHPPGSATVQVQVAGPDGFVTSESLIIPIL